MERPHEDDLLILKNLLKSSKIDQKFHEDLEKNIDEIDNFEDYGNYLYRLQDLQPSIDEIPNPSQTDITRHIKRFT